MTRLLLVHGTGTRDPDYSTGLQRVSQALAKLPNIRVHPCYWGEPCGARLHLGGASIPTYPETKSVGGLEEPMGVMDADRIEVLWDLLERDPAFELYLIRPGINRDADLGGGATPAPLLRMDAGLGSSVAGRKLEERLAGLGLPKEFAVAAGVVRGLPAAWDAADQPGGVAAIARSVISFMAFIHPGINSKAARAVADATTRDELFQYLAEHLQGAGDEKGISDIVSGLANAAGTVLTGMAGLATLKTGTWLGERRRGKLMDAATPAAGDILLYQARGKQIRDFIRKQIADGPEDVVLLAHSLGGVACVDLLIETPDLPVRQLITVGSQAPFFYEVGALQMADVLADLKAGKAPADRLPKKFPPWLNCYDLRDFLSYVGRPVFGDKVTDVPVDNGHMFPSSHTSYWSNEEVWEAVRERLRKL